MDLTVPQSLVYAASWFTITGGVWALFERAETVASKETKASISNWLTDITVPDMMLSWPESFARVFDDVFGRRHLTLSCFARSCVASTVSVLIVTLLWFVFRPDELKVFGRYSIDDPLWVAGEYFMPGILVNLIPDYVSLLETRYVIRLMSHSRSTIRHTLLLFADILFTTSICVIGFVLFSGAVALVNSQSLAQSLAEVFGSLLHYGVRLSATDASVAPLGIWFYSAFFTSVWLWIYVGLGVAIRTIKVLRAALVRAKPLFDIEGKPLRTLGFVANIAVTIAYVVMILVR